MKLLWTGNFFDGSGYATAGRDYLLALDAVGVDVVARPFRLNANKVDVPTRIRELVAKPAAGCDVVIQHTLPTYMERHPSFHKSVALFAWETNNFRRSGWARRLNLMDQVIVINESQASACRLSGVKTPISVVPHATDVTRFERSHAPLEFLRPYLDAGDFVFYTVGEFTRRKNFHALLKAFHTEFRRGERVRLLLKTSVPGVSSEEGLNQVKSMCEAVKRGLRFSPRHCSEEIILTGRMSDEYILRLHASCGCFVTASMGEACSLPCLDAMAMGRTPIAPRSTGFLSYLDGTVGTLVGTRTEAAFGVTDAPPGLYSGHEDWESPNPNELRAAMRTAFERKDRERKDMAARGLARAYQFSYAAVGGLLLKALGDEHEPKYPLDGPAR